MESQSYSKRALSPHFLSRSALKGRARKLAGAYLSSDTVKEILGANTPTPHPRPIAPSFLRPGPPNFLIAFESLREIVIRITTRSAMPEDQGTKRKANDYGLAAAEKRSKVSFIFISIFSFLNSLSHSELLRCPCMWRRISTIRLMS